MIVHAPAGLEIKKGADILRVTELRAHDVRAEFTPEVLAALASDPNRVAAIASRILERHFPESLHTDILNAVGLTLETAITRRKRGPAFRQRGLKAYGYRGAVCGFDVRLGPVSIALDAAHIRWLQAGGPDAEDNGLALCVLHHKTFDLGAFTVRDGILLVSDQANGTTGFQEALLAYHGRPSAMPSTLTGGRSRSISNGMAARYSRARRGIGLEGHHRQSPARLYPAASASAAVSNTRRLASLVPVAPRQLGACKDSRGHA